MKSTLISDMGNTSASDASFSSKAPQPEIEELEEPMPSGITYKLPLPPPGVDLHEYMRESIQVKTTKYVSDLHLIQCPNFTERTALHFSFLFRA